MKKSSTKSITKSQDSDKGQGTEEQEQLVRVKPKFYIAVMIRCHM